MDASGPIQDWSYWYNRYVSEGAKNFDLQKEIERLQKENNYLKECQEVIDSVQDFGAIL